MNTPSTSPAAIPLDDLYAIEDLPKTNPRVINVTGLRWQLRHRKENGLASACLRIGKRILISKSRYEQWLATQVESELAA